MKQSCSTCKADFELKPEELEKYSKAGIPASTQCARCSIRDLFSFWIFGRFRVAKSALSGKSLITVLPESAPFPIYEREEFISDAWDPLEYGQDYDSSRSFLDQLKELQAKVPHPHQIGTQNVNCQWADDWWQSKNCYLCRSGFKNEDLSYAYRVTGSKNCLDITYSFDMEHSYDCLYCFKCYGVQYAFDSRDCMNSAFLYDCRNVQSSFMCWNLRNKSYCILNQQYTKDEYEQKMKEYNLKSAAAVEKLKRVFKRRLQEDATHRANFNMQTASSSGNFLSETKNCIDCAFVEKSENCHRVMRGYEAKDSIEVVGILGEQSACLIRRTVATVPT